MAQRGRPKKQPTITKIDTKDKTNSSNTSESVILTEDYNFASNIRLKKVGVKVALTAAQVKEYKKCADDPVYFIEKYVKFMTLDKGITNVSLYDFQKDLINTYHDNRMVIVKCGRQLGKTSTTTGYLLHYILFNEDKTAAVLAQKEKVANEILSKIKMAYEYIPLWMQQGVVSWNATSIELENGCRILCESTSSGSIRGFTISCITGDSLVDIRINGKNKKISIYELESILANSSKYNRVLTNTGYYYESNFSEQQIYKNLLQINGKGLFSRSNQRNSSYNTPFLGGKQSTGQFEASFSQSSFISSSIIDENDREKNETQNVICLSYDEIWETGEIVKIGPQFKKTIIETIFDSYVRDSERKNKNSDNQRQTIISFIREEIIRRTQKEDIRNEDWIKERNFSFRRAQDAHSSSIKRKIEKQRTYSQNKPQSGKNQKNCIETYRDEKVRSDAPKDVSSCQGENSLEQRIEVKTKNGYKPFRGMKVTYQQEVIKLIAEGYDLTCTPNHLIYTEDGWKEAKHTLNNKIYTTKGWKKVENLSINGYSTVYDLTEVEEEHSFFANDILVHNCLYLDEFAHVPSHVAEDFFTAVYPTISSGKKSKIIITSTPFGLNMYYRFWMDALKKKKDPKNWNGFVPFEMHWTQVPGRTKDWAEQQRKILGEHKYAQDIEAEFLGSSNTLINGKTLRNLVFVPEIESMFEDSLKVYEKPIKRHTYVISADPSQGKGLDYSAFTVFDVTEAPYQVVARFRNNLTEDIMFANYIVTAAKHYNDAYVIVENNDIGALVLNHIIQEFDYDNLFYSYTDKGNFGEISAGQGVQAKVPGVRTTRKIKTQGCSKLKTIIENQQIILNDFDIISELSTFVLDKTKQYNAEEGYHDDMVSTLWIFAWLTAQPLFKEISDLNLRARLFAERERLAEESLPPVPVIQSNNYKPSPLSIDKSTGTIWINSEQTFDEAIEQLNDWLLDR